MREFEVSDLSQINAWYKARGVHPLGPGQARMTGYIVDGVAAGFLMQTDAEVAYLENMVSNPAADPRTASRAIDIITSALMARARALGFKQVAAITQHASVARRAQRHAMTRHPERYSLLTKTLY